jgi:hypothetical protein
VGENKELHLKISLVLGCWIILLIFLAIAIPNIGYSQGPCPKVPAGALSPQELLKTNWVLVTNRTDTTYGLQWLFMRNQEPGAKITYSLAIGAAGEYWPVLVNYLEDGVLKFLVLDITAREYKWDADIALEDYNAVARFYNKFFGINIELRKGA